MNQESIDVIKQSHKTTLMIWVAFVVSLGMYTMAIEFLSQTSHQTQTQNPGIEIIKYVFWIISASYLMIFPVLKIVIIKRKPMTMESNPKPIPKSVQTYSIIVFALSESVCLYGFALFFIGHNKMDYYIMFFASLIYFMINFPRKSNWE